MKITIDRIINDADALVDMALAERKEDESVEKLSRHILIKLLGRLSIYSPDIYNRIFNKG